MARFRAENILINDLKGAWYSVDSDTTMSGKPATWLKGIIPFMSLRKSLAQALLLRLQDSDFDSHNYVAKHFFSELPQIFTDTADIKRCARAIAQSITAGNGFLESYLWLHSRDYPESWYGPLAEALAPLTDPNSPKWFLPDGTPLLTAVDNEEDDIPF